MNETEVNQQITQMVQFIYQEAKEKAAEIKLKADEEFNIEKLRMVEAEKQKIRTEYERKEKQVEIQKRIDQSNKLRESRLETLKARDDAISGVLQDAEKQLTSIVKGKEYDALLEKLIVEALVRLMDKKVSVSAVKGQEKAVEKALGSAVSKFKAVAESEKGASWASEIGVTLSPNSLTEGVGGVMVEGFGGKIKLENTLTSRLHLAFETRLPQVREALFA